MLASIFIGASICFAENSARNSTIIAVDTGDPSVVRFLVTTKQILEATVSLRCDTLKNVKSSSPLPVNFVVVKPYQRFEFLRLTRAVDGEPWFYHYKTLYKIGVPSAKTTVDYVYALPYASNEKHNVTQSYFGAHSHYQGSQTEYAVDFSMPEGSKVLAARPGTVIEYRDDSNKGGDDKSFEHDCNEVIVKHDDGTYASYVHLKQHGVLVKLGQCVQVGTPIGLSGNTGWSSSPHLHFGILRVVNGEKILSLPFKMKTSRGVLDHLMAGEFY